MKKIGLIYILLFLVIGFIWIKFNNYINFFEQNIDTIETVSEYKSNDLYTKEGNFSIRFPFSDLTYMRLKNGASSWFSISEAGDQTGSVVVVSHQSNRDNWQGVLDLYFRDEKKGGIINVDTFSVSAVEKNILFDHYYLKPIFDKKENDYTTTHVYVTDKYIYVVFYISPFIIDPLQNVFFESFNILP